jgi:septal ring factor EnvC (AmiA/AmiB activator)
MFSPLSSILLQYGGAVLAGIAAGLMYKVYFASQVQRKIKNYQGEIVRSHAKILEHEAKNDQLEKRLKDFEKNFKTDRLLIN